MAASPNKTTSTTVKANTLDLLRKASKASYSAKVLAYLHSQPVGLPKIRPQNEAGKAQSCRPARSCVAGADGIKKPFGKLQKL